QPVSSSPSSGQRGEEISIATGGENSVTADSDVWTAGASARAVRDAAPADRTTARVAPAPQPAAGDIEAPCPPSPYRPEIRGEVRRRSAERRSGSVPRGAARPCSSRRGRGGGRASGAGGGSWRGHGGGG